MRLGWLVLGLVGLVATRARAETAKRRIEICIAAAPAEGPSLETAILGPLNRLHVDVHVTHVERLDPRDVVTPTAAPTSASVRVWFDLENQKYATIYMADETWERVLVRRIPLDHGLDEVGREALAFLTRSSVDAMLSGAQIGISREEAKEVIGIDHLPPKDAAGEPDARAERGGLPTWGFGLNYDVGAYARALPVVQGPGISVLLSDRNFRRRAWLTGTYRMPSQIESDSVSVRVTSLDLRAGFALNARIGPAWWISGGLGAGVDSTRLEPQVNEGLRAVNVATLTTWTFSVRPVVGIAWALKQTMVLLEAGADIDPARTQYIVRTDGVGSYVLSPWPVRPNITFSMLLGTQSFEPTTRE